MYRNGVKGTPADTVSVPSRIRLIMCIYHEPCNVDQLMIKCDSVRAKVVVWEQTDPMDMSTMQGEYEIKRQRDEGYKGM